MAISFNVPSSPKKQIYQSSTFLGADFTSEASVVDDTKSPNCENMIRSVPGKIRKRMGYEEVGDYGQSIFGVHYYSTEDTWLVHAGTNLYSLNGVKGQQWDVIDVAAYGTYNEIRAYYQEEIPNFSDTYRIGINKSEQGNVYIYEIWDKRPYPAKQMPDPDPPEAYPDYLYKSYYTMSFVVDGKYYFYYYYHYEVVGDNPYDVVTHDQQTGIFLLDGDVENTKVGEGLALHRSTAFELNHKLLILDGTTAWLYDKNGLSRLTDNEDGYSDIAFIPTTTINKDPVGQTSEQGVGNKSLDALNMATAAYINSFIVDETHGNLKVFQMEFAPLDDGTPVKVEVMDAQGEWHEKTLERFGDVERRGS